jgi:hypothetical protein
MKLLIVNISSTLFEAPEQVLALPIGPRNDEKKTIIDKDVHAKDSERNTVNWCKIGKNRVKSRKIFLYKKIGLC